MLCVNFLDTAGWFLHKGAVFRDDRRLPKLVYNVVTQSRMVTQGVGICSVFSDIDEFFFTAAR